MESLDGLQGEFSRLSDRPNWMREKTQFRVKLARLRKDSRIRVNQEESIPQGLKPDIYFVVFAARLKSCPDASGSRGVFPQPASATVALVANCTYPGLKVLIIQPVFRGLKRGAHPQCTYGAGDGSSCFLTSSTVIDIS
jgi:hypothetical protein